MAARSTQKRVTGLELGFFRACPSFLELSQISHNLSRNKRIRI